MSEEVPLSWSSFVDASVNKKGPSVAAAPISSAMIDGPPVTGGAGSDVLVDGGAGSDVVVVVVVRLRHMKNPGWFSHVSSLGHGENKHSSISRKKG